MKRNQSQIFGLAVGGAVALAILAGPGVAAGFLAFMLLLIVMLILLGAY